MFGPEIRAEFGLTPATKSRPRSGRLSLFPGTKRGRLLRRGLGHHVDNLYPSINRVSRSVGVLEPALTVTDGHEICAVDAIFLDQVALDGVGTALGEILVEGVAADAVGVTGDHKSVAKQQQLTVRKIAELIRRPHEEMGTVVDRIRGWADFGLLKVTGDKHPGTGKKRLYEPAAILGAMVLTALTDVGLAAVRVGHFANDDGRTVLQFGLEGACQVLDPGQHVRPAFLVIAGPSPSPFTVFVSYGETKLNQLPPSAPWSIVLNLAEYFRPLRGIVTAVQDGRGFVKVEMMASKGD
jgi:hypothetical protein